MSPIVKLLQATGGMDEGPLEASTAAAPWPPILSSTGLMQDIVIRAAAAAELAGMFWRHAAAPAWSGWLPQGFSTQPIHAQIEVGQQPWQLHPVVAVAGAAGVQQQLVSVMSYLAQQHNQPEMYCLDGELLACSC